jgi:hypothetical protein
MGYFSNILLIYTNGDKPYIKKNQKKKKLHIHRP